MGLRAARDAGIHVPDEVRNKCIDYVKKSQNSDGGFRYQISSGGGSTFPLTAAGVVSLYSAGIYDGEQVEKGLKWLMNYLPGKGSSNTGYFFYGHYYAVQAMWHAGGEYWQKWYPAIRDTLLARQTGDGSFADSEVCPEFGTAMACIILQMPNRPLRRDIRSHAVRQRRRRVRVLRVHQRNHHSDAGRTARTRREHRFEANAAHGRSADGSWRRGRSSSGALSALGR
jgi:hypothetical protein